MATPGGTVSLDGMYPGGVLVEGPLLQQIDEVIVQEPHRVTMREVKAHLAGTTERDALLFHLEQLCRWFSRATHDDDRAEVWVRGNLVSTLWPDPDKLDVVLIHSLTPMHPTDRWILGALMASPVTLNPGRLVVTPLRHDGPEHTNERADEARRSRVAVRRMNGDPVESGWLSIVVGEED